ncbi:FGGY-family carbohydrate kinase [Roseicyclus sp. F158]|uniref:FGGY-family carbohydrate kinase n=1 Tax=Tropicimonas omnivorans TaxID=3075590 RepID=A0ABU3DFA0_9RHOB|nr:FGGY family carbohydrate kinase [Roseicyclus sp. F158]MDT0682402.1 FGGY-family carbohydrate kinase [Roseicyclus sp. F158]
MPELGENAAADWFIGFDIGSTAVKVGLFDDEGQMLAQWSRSYPTDRPRSGWVEQDPRHWVDGVRDGIDAVLEGRDARRVAAVGMCSQVNTEVFAGADGSALAPAITWQDGRAHAQADWINARVSDADKMAWWGAQMPIGASHVLAKMLWMAENHPDLWERTHLVLSPKDYVLLKLTGQAVSDPISSFGQVGLDLEYIAPLLDLLPGAREKLPQLRAFTDIVGDMPLGQTGLRAPVVAGTMDAWGNLFGCGRFAAGQGMYVSGTSEILAVVNDKRVGAPGVVTFVPVEGLTVNAGPTQSGADSLRWWGETVGKTPAELVTLAESADRSASRVLFLPQLQGERAPLWNSSLRGAFVGLDSRSAGPELAMAVLEGVAFSARHLFETLVEAAGCRPEFLLYGGGGARSDLWSQIRADVLGVPLHRFECTDVGCLGAAILAAVGIGAFPDMASAVPRMTRVDRVFTPDPGQQDRYAQMFDAYRGAITALEPITKT